jgi:hypothetical protein
MALMADGEFIAVLFTSHCWNAYNPNSRNELDRLYRLMPDSAPDFLGSNHALFGIRASEMKPLLALTETLA